MDEVREVHQAEVRGRRRLAGEERLDPAPRGRGQLRQCGDQRQRNLVLAKIEATHADGLLLNQQFGWTKHEHLMESLGITVVHLLRRTPEGLEREAVHIRFYSDHVSDAPTHHWSDEPVAANAHDRLMRLAEAEGWEVLDWRDRR